MYVGLLRLAVRRIGDHGAAVSSGLESHGGAGGGSRRWRIECVIQDQRDEYGEVDDRQEVREGGAISAHGWKVSGVGGVICS
jgi:hypothetical protein